MPFAQNSNYKSKVNSIYTYDEEVYYLKQYGIRHQ